MFCAFYACLLFATLGGLRGGGLDGLIRPADAIAVGAFFLFVGDSIAGCTLGVLVAAMLVRFLLGDDPVLALPWAGAHALTFGLLAWGCAAIELGHTALESEGRESLPKAVMFLLAALLGTLPGALLGTAAQLWVSGEDVLPTLLLWWVPEAASAVLLLPPFLIWHFENVDPVHLAAQTPLTTGGPLEHVLAWLALALSALLASRYHEPMLLNLGACVLLWFAFRLGLFSTALAVAAFAIVEVGLHLFGLPGAIAAAAPGDLLRLQGYLVFTAIPALILASIMRQRDLQHQALSEDQRRLTYALDGANDGIWDWHVPSDSLFLSPRAYRMLGLPPTKERCNFATFRSHIHADDLAIIDQAFADHRDGHHPLYQCEFRGRHANGSTIWLLCRGKIVEQDAAGRPVRVVGTLTDISHKKHLETALAHAASHDPLTGLANRAAFERALQQAHQRLARDGMPFAVLLIDIDHFKAVNDNHGHMIGDLLLTTTARRLQSAVRAGDVVARFGGDEFAMIAAGRHVEEFGHLAERLHAHLSKPVETDGTVLPSSFSIGMAVADDDRLEVNALIAEADAALYIAKNSGRGTWRVARLPDPAQGPIH